MTRGKSNSGSGSAGSSGGTRGKRTLSPQAKINLRLNGLTKRKDSAEEKANNAVRIADNLRIDHPEEFHKWANQNPKRASNLGLKPK